MKNTFLQRYNDFIDNNQVAMFSFSTCPFCRRAKDLLEQENIPYAAIELDELEDNEGNEIRAVLGKKDKTNVGSQHFHCRYLHWWLQRRKSGTRAIDGIGRAGNHVEEYTITVMSSV